MSIRERGFKRLVKVSDALNMLLSKVSRKDAIERVSLLDAIGRVLAEDIVAEEDIPCFNRSAVDGYAVRSRDTFGASHVNPVKLKVVGRVDVGETPSISVSEGEAVEIATGAVIPDGADAVVMYEDVKAVDGEIDVFKPVTPLENVSLKGEDVKKGEVVARKGLILRPWDIGVLASLNIPYVNVVAKVKVAVFSTGNELVEVGERPPPGKLVNSTKSLVLAAVKELGCETLDLGLVPDDVEKIVERMREGVNVADVLITTGGTSIGKRDYVREALEKAGGSILAHGIAMKPGKPTGLGLLEGKPVIMLSGYPVAALVGFEAFIKPLIYHMLGAQEQPRAVIKARLTRRVASTPGTRSYLRVFVEKRGDVFYAEPLRLTGSGVLSSVVKANGIVIIPEHRDGFDEGEEVYVQLIRPVEEGF